MPSSLNAPLKESARLNIPRDDSESKGVQATAGSIEELKKYLQKVDARVSVQQLAEEYFDIAAPSVEYRAKEVSGCRLGTRARGRRCRLMINVDGMLTRGELKSVANYISQCVQQWKPLHYDDIQYRICVSGASIAVARDSLPARITGPVPAVNRVCSHDFARSLDAGKTVISVSGDCQKSAGAAVVGSFCTGLFAANVEPFRVEWAIEHQDRSHLQLRRLVRNAPLLIAADPKDPIRRCWVNGHATLMKAHNRAEVFRVQLPEGDDFDQLKLKWQTNCIEGVDLFVNPVVFAVVGRTRINGVATYQQVHHPPCVPEFTFQTLMDGSDGLESISQPCSISTGARRSPIRGCELVASIKQSFLSILSVRVMVSPTIGNRIDLPSDPCGDRQLPRRLDIRLRVLPGREYLSAQLVEAVDEYCQRLLPDYTITTRLETK